MKKNVYLKHGVPATVKLIEVTLKSYGKNIDSRNYQIKFDCVYKEADRYVECYTSLEKVLKSKKKFFFVRFKGAGPVFYDSQAEYYAIRDNLLETKDKFYFDFVRCHRRDFSYDEPYECYVFQPELKNKYIKLREKYANVHEVLIHVDELNNELYHKIQRLAIDKYKALYFTNYSRNKKPKITRKIPVILRNAKLDFQNAISFKFERNYVHSKNYENKHVMLMHQEGTQSYHDRSLRGMYKESIYLNVSSLKEVEDELDQYNEFITKVLPNFRTP